MILQAKVTEAHGGSSVPTRVATGFLKTWVVGLRLSQPVDACRRPVEKSGLLILGEVRHHLLERIPQHSI